MKAFRFTIRIRRKIPPTPGSDLGDYVTYYTGGSDRPPWGDYGGPAYLKYSEVLTVLSQYEGSLAELEITPIDYTQILNTELSTYVGFLSIDLESVNRIRTELGLAPLNLC